MPCFHRPSIPLCKLVTATLVNHQSNCHCVRRFVWTGSLGYRHTSASPPGLIIKNKKMELPYSSSRSEEEATARAEVPITAPEVKDNHTCLEASSVPRHARIY